MSEGRFIAANAGWYMMPDFETNYPYGLKNSGLGLADLLCRTRDGTAGVDGRGAGMDAGPLAADSCVYRQRGREPQGWAGGRVQCAATQRDAGQSRAVWSACELPGRVAAASETA